MKKAAMCAFVMLFAVSAQAQGKARKVSASLMANFNAIDKGVNKGMDTEASRINFSRWDAPVGFVDSAKGFYEAQRQAAARVHVAISKIKASGTASSIQLFNLFSDFRSVAQGISAFASDADQSQKDPELAADLFNISTDLVDEESKLDDFVQTSILQDSSDLAACKK